VGLSILIPVYNYNVSSLVKTLAAQLIKTGKEGEIILLDDGSSKAIITSNQPLQDIPFVSFHQNEKNEGRMVARQKLSGLARYNYLLFLDCDSEIIKEDFVAIYFDLMEKNLSLASGRRIYPDEPPKDCDLQLHWKYGTKRENRNRNKKGNDNPGFMSNNFLIKRELFSQLNDSVQLTGYGHEDSWWGIQFEQSGIECIYADNPVLHSSLEKADVFLSKSENALANLLVLEKSTDKKLLSRHVKIYRWYKRFNSAGLSNLFLFFEKPFHNYFRRNLLSCKPNLLFFDCYRLAILLKMGKKVSIV
jgi:hypothetical protein